MGLLTVAQVRRRSTRATHPWCACSLSRVTSTHGFAVCIFGEDHLRACWRISLGLGVVPAAAVFLWRLRMSETASYKRYAMKHSTPYLLIFRKYWRSFLVRRSLFSLARDLMQYSASRSYGCA